jgi:hypothetical protein
VELMVNSFFTNAFFLLLIFKILPHNLCLVLNKFSKNCSVVIKMCFTYIENILDKYIYKYNLKPIILQIFWICLYIVNDFLRSLLIYFNDLIVLVFSNTNIHNFFRCCCLHLNCFLCLTVSFFFYKCFLYFV